MLSLSDEVLRGFAARALGSTSTSVAELSIEPMPGGASTRSYYRAVSSLTTSTHRSVVVMFVPDSRPDEVTGGALPTEWPFIEIQRLLHGRGVRVPRLVAEAYDQGLIAIEDLGDSTLAAYLEANPGGKEEIYRRAVSDLAEAQKKLSRLPDGSIVAGRCFDQTLLKWEIDHFLEWGLEAQGIHLVEADKKLFDSISERLAKRVEALPRSFVHRDYQSRNIMVLEDSTLVWIDFQDALLGPRVYDLVALLGDSYQTFDDSFIDRRLDDYAQHAGLSSERNLVGYEFNLVTVQRKLKDAGRFVFIDRVRKNPNFLQYVEPTIAKVMRALDKLRGDADMDLLRELLGRVLPR